MSVKIFRKKLVKEGLIEENTLSEGIIFDNIAFLISLPLAYYALKYLTVGMMNLAAKAMGKKFYPSDNAVKASNELWKDNGFTKDFATIIKNEGDFNEFIKRTKTLSDRGYDDYNSINWGGFQKYKNAAVGVTEKVMKTTSFKRIANKYKLDKDEIQFIGNNLFYTITDEDFRKKALEIRNSVFKDMAEDEWGNKPSKKR
jgi:hypothetical protein